MFAPSSVRSVGAVGCDHALDELVGIAFHRNKVPNQQRRIGKLEKCNRAAPERPWAEEGGRRTTSFSGGLTIIGLLCYTSCLKPPVD